MQSTTLVTLGEYLKSLERSDSVMQLLPIKQLLVIMTDLINVCESVHVKHKMEIGFLDFVKQHYFKKYHGAYDKYMSQLLKSVLKHSKPNSELAFYSTLMANNVDSQILVPVSKAITLLKKKLALGFSTEGRGDDLCRKATLSYADVVESCKKIFNKLGPFNAKEYEELGGACLKHRVRDYILKIQTHSTVLESNGLTFLEIVLREAALIREQLEKLQTELRLKDSTDNAEIHEELEKSKAGEDQASSKHKPRKSIFPENRLVDLVATPPQERSISRESRSSLVVSAADNLLSVIIPKKSAKSPATSIKRSDTQDQPISPTLPNFEGLKRKSGLISFTNRQVAEIRRMSKALGASLTPDHHKTPELKPVPEFLDNDDPPLYTMADLLGEEMPRMSDAKIKSIRHMQEEDMKFFAQPLIGNNAPINHRSNSREHEESDYQVPDDVTFDDLYSKKILNKKEDQMCLNVVKDCKHLEDKIQMLKADLEALPQIDDCIQEHVMMVSNAIQKKKNMSKFIHSSLLKLNNKMDVSVDPDFLKETIELYKFYEHFCLGVDQIIGKQRITDRHSLSEYITPLNGQKGDGSLIMKTSQKASTSNFEEATVENTEKKPQEKVADKVLNILGDNSLPRQRARTSSLPLQLQFPLSKGNIGEFDQAKYQEKIAKFMYTLISKENAEKQNYDSQKEFEANERAVKEMIEEEEEEVMNQKFEESEDGEKARPLKRMCTTPYSRQKTNQSEVKLESRNSIVKPRIKIRDSAHEEIQDNEGSLKDDFNNSKKQNQAGPMSCLIPHQKQSQKKQQETDTPAFPKDLDRSKYENMIYDGKKRKMYIVAKEARFTDKNCISLRQGDVVCSVKDFDGWNLVYFEDNPKKYGFYPTSYLSFIN